MLLTLYLAIRLPRLTALPLFADEAGYLSWGLRALHATAWPDWLASVEDGKQPLFAWLLPPFLALLDDRVLAGRLLSVLLGAANLASLVVLGRRLFGQVTGYLAGALYVVAPIAVIHDRMALYETLIATTSLLVLLATLRWAEFPTWKRTGWLGLAMGAAVLSKLSVTFFLVLVPLVVLLWRPRVWRQTWRLAVAGALAVALYSVLYLSPHAAAISGGNFSRYALTPREVLEWPVALWRHNAAFIMLVARAYLGTPLAVVTALALLYGLLLGGRGTRADWIATLWALVPLLAFLLTAKLFYARYLTFCLVTTLLPAAHLLAWPVTRWGAAGSPLTACYRNGAAASPLPPSPRWGEAPGHSPVEESERASEPLPPPAGEGWGGGTPAGEGWGGGTPAEEGGRGGRSGVLIATGLVWLAVLAPALGFDLALLRDPLTTPWLDARDYMSERWQLIQGDESGYGLGEITALLRAEAAQAPIVVLGQERTGYARDGLIALLGYRPGIVVGTTVLAPPLDGHDDESITQRLLRAPDAVYRAAAAGADVYYVTSSAPGGDLERHFAGANPGLAPLLTLPKPDGKSRFLLYKARLFDGPQDRTLPLPAQFDDQIVLRRFRLDADSTALHAGQSVNLVLDWEALGRPSGRYTVFTQVLNPAGPAPDHIWAQSDAEPLRGQDPTTTWQPNTHHPDRYTLHLADDTPPGTYQLIAGLYDRQTMRRLPVRLGQAAPSNHVLLAALQVVG